MSEVDQSLKCKSCKQSCWSMTLETEENGGKPWGMCAGCRTESSRADRALARVAELEAERSASGGWVRITPRPKPMYLVSDIREGFEYGLFIIDLAIDAMTAVELSESPDRDAFVAHMEHITGHAAVAWLSTWQPDQSGEGGS